MRESLRLQSALYYHTFIILNSDIGSGWVKYDTRVTRVANDAKENLIILHNEVIYYVDLYVYIGCGWIEG